MNYSKIITYDTSNCKGFSTTIWLSGCPHKCEECFNPELWDCNYGNKFTDETKRKIIDSFNQKYINNFVILGGEPLSIDKREEIVELCRDIKKEKPFINIIVYTGYTFYEIEEKYRNKLFPYIDFLIDGKYDKTRKIESSQLRGSTNQRCYLIVHNEYPYKIMDITNFYFN